MIRVLRQNSLLIMTVLTVLVVGIGDVYAESDQFTISQQIGTPDSEPPSVPGGFTTTAVATTQIDLSWASSTDNVGVAGYRVFRDNVHIATTTQITYSDSGLTPSTTYSYRVDAFDALFNFSTSTATSSATTFSLPVATTSPTSGSGDTSIASRIAPPDSIFSDVTVRASTDTVVLSWQTSLHTRSSVKWGTTGSYELGVLTEEVFNTVHETAITGLLPDTVYEFQIESVDGYGRVTTYVGRFKTESLPDLTAPANVRNLIAIRDGEDILLEWENPTEGDFSHVRIQRSPLFYPGHPFDGFIAYEGDDETYRDTGVALRDGALYYTVFAYDERGNVSSGAVVRVVVVEEGVVETPREGIEEIDFGDLTFFQDNVAKEMTDTTVVIDSGKRFAVNIDYDTLPEHLKTILITLTDPEDSELTFSFLLRVNDEKTRYGAVVAPLQKAGAYAVTFSVFDFEEQQLFTSTGTVIAKSFGEEDPEERVPNTVLWTRVLTLFVWPMIVLLMILLYARTQKHKVRKKHVHA